MHLHTYYIHTNQIWKGQTRSLFEIWKKQKKKHTVVIALIELHNIIATCLAILSVLRLLIRLPMIFYADLSDYVIYVFSKQQAAGVCLAWWTTVFWSIWPRPKSLGFYMVKYTVGINSIKQIWFLLIICRIKVNIKYTIITKVFNGNMFMYVVIHPGSLDE